MQKSWEDESSFSDFIISHLLSCSSIRIQRRVLFELVQKKRNKNRKYFNSNLSRLKDNGLISISGDIISFNKKDLRSHFAFRNMSVKPTGEIQILVLFDISEKKRKIRNWLRSQLKLWNFKMVQQSAWLGDGPLPKEFSERLKLLEVKDCVKVFKIQNNK
jgi:hypothetical protein